MVMMERKVKEPAAGDSAEMWKIPMFVIEQTRIQTSLWGRRKIQIQELRRGISRRPTKCCRWLAVLGI